MTGSPLLEVRHLNVSFRNRNEYVPVVRDVEFDVPKGKCIALLGESGCGKSVTARALLNMILPPGQVDSGSVTLQNGGEGTDLLGLGPNSKRLRQIRWREIAMIFQDPVSSLTPVYTVGEQIAEAIMTHDSASRKDAQRRGVELLREVGIPAPERRFSDYPHQMSGGMCQRVMIAMALACRPSLLIADEPTTALDVTIQGQILELLRNLQKQRGMAILLITHDLGVVAELADEVLVMYLGRIVERGPVADIFDNPQHPYTRALLASVPTSGHSPGEALPTIRGTVPDLRDAPQGCPFRGRCEEEIDRCRDMPGELEVGRAHWAACWTLAGNQ